MARADHEQHVDLGEHLLDRQLAIRGRVTDVFLPRADDRRKAFAQRGKDLRGLVDGEGGLCHVRDALRIGYLDDARLFERLDEHDRTGRLARRADDLVVTGMPDKDHAVAGVGEAPHLNVHLRHERARGVDRCQVPVGSLAVDLGRDAVRREDEPSLPRYVGRRLDEDRAACFEVAHHVRVVDDLLAHVDGWPVDVEGAFDGLDGSLDSGAKAAVRRDDDALHHRVPCSDAASSAPTTRSKQARSRQASSVWDDAAARSCWSR